METNTNRIENDIIQLAKFSETKSGITRSAYSHENKLARNYLINEMKKLDLEITEDSVGTLFGRRKGTSDKLPAILIGSHYDSVVNGGAYDGVVGTVIGLEVMRVLQENDFSNRHPIVFVAMNAEEGETFGPSTGVTNSRAIVGSLTDIELESVKNRFGQTKKAAMLDYGVSANLEEAKWELNQIKNFIEFHIEQGKILEQSEVTIGIVEYLPGIGRYVVNFEGEVSDTTIRLSNRKDALLAASMFTVSFNEIIKSLGNDVTGSVNEITAHPNSIQFVSGNVEVKIEVRTHDSVDVSSFDLRQLMKTKLKEIENLTGVKSSLKEIRRINYPNPTAASIMDKKNIKIVKKICENHGISSMILNNGTGHDAMIMAEHVPTTLIYVPSRNGITHNPQEWTDIEDIGKGATVLLELVKETSL